MRKRERGKEAERESEEERDIRINCWTPMSTLFLRPALSTFGHLMIFLFLKIFTITNRERENKRE